MTEVIIDSVTDLGENGGAHKGGPGMEVGAAAGWSIKGATGTSAHGEGVNAGSGVHCENHGKSGGRAARHAGGDRLRDEELERKQRRGDQPCKVEVGGGGTTAAVYKAETPLKRRPRPRP